MKPASRAERRGDGRSCRPVSSVSNRCEGLIKTNNANLAERAAVASRLPEISEAIAGAPDVDRRKVESVREALARGAYRVDPGRIANKLIQLEKALLNGGDSKTALEQRRSGRSNPTTR